MNVSCGPSDRLNQRPLRSQKPFLVRVQNRHQGHFWHVQALSKQIDANQHVERAQPEIPNYLGSLDGTDIRMQISYPYAMLVQVGINLLREGLDMPEVSLVAILDAAKGGIRY